MQVLSSSGHLPNLPKSAGARDDLMRWTHRRTLGCLDYKDGYTWSYSVGTLDVNPSGTCIRPLDKRGRRCPT